MFVGKVYNKETCFVRVKRHFSLVTEILEGNYLFLEEGVVGREDFWVELLLSKFPGRKWARSVNVGTKLGEKVYPLLDGGIIHEFYCLEGGRKKFIIDWDVRDTIKDIPIVVEIIGNLDELKGNF